MDDNFYIKTAESERQQGRSLQSAAWRYLRIQDLIVAQIQKYALTNKFLHNKMLGQFDLDRPGYLITSVSETARAAGGPSCFTADRNRAILQESQEKVVKGTGRWSLKQEMKYILFLQEFSPSFESSQHRKKDQIFKQMARHIPSRTVSQCKSHHQKKLISHGRSFLNIIDRAEKDMKGLSRERQNLTNTSDRVLIQRYDEINSSQSYYRILGFNNSRYKIEINTRLMRSY